MADEATTPSGDGEDDAIEALVRLGERYLTWPELCRRASVEHEVADRLWRALGFPDVPPDEPVYTDDDIRALRIAAQGIDRLTGEERARAVELLVREARQVSAYVGRLTEVEVDMLAELGRVGLRQEAIADAAEHGIQNSDYGWVIFYVLRRRLDEALRRRATSEPGETPDLAVGFIDLVDFTGTSASLDVEEFGRLLNRFEALAWDVVTEASGQVVKLIGDEAMFVCPSAREAAAAALEVIEACARSRLPRARAGLSAGPLLARGGDYFGAPVNVASRLVDHAQPGSALVDEAMRERLGDKAAAVRHDGTRSLKGIGEVEVWRLEPAAGR
jgi:adenylate cyclase